MFGVSLFDYPPPFARSRACSGHLPFQALRAEGEAGHDQDVPFLERFKPVLIDLILVQMGWPAIGLKTGLKDLIVCCFALCFAQWGLVRLG